MVFFWGKGVPLAKYKPGAYRWQSSSHKERRISPENKAAQRKAEPRDGKRQTPDCPWALGSNHAWGDLHYDISLLWFNRSSLITQVWPSWISVIVKETWFTKAIVDKLSTYQWFMNSALWNLQLIKAALIFIWWLLRFYLNKIVVLIKRKKNKRSYSIQLPNFRGLEKPCGFYKVSLWREYAWSLPIHPEHNPLSPNAASTSHISFGSCFGNGSGSMASSHYTQTHKRIQHGLPAFDTCYTLRTELHTCHALIKEPRCHSCRVYEGTVNI